MKSKLVQYKIVLQSQNADINNSKLVSETPRLSQPATDRTPQQREEEPNNQIISQTICHSANQLSLDAHPVFLNTQEETQLKQSSTHLVLLSEGRANFSNIQKQKSWQEIFDIKEVLQQVIDDLKKQNTELKEEKLKLEVIIHEKDNVMLGMWKDFIGIHTFQDFEKVKQNGLGFISKQTSQLTSFKHSPICSQEDFVFPIIQTENSQDNRREYCCYCDCVTQKLLAEHHRECDLQKRFVAVIGKYGNNWKVGLGNYVDFNETGKHITCFPQYRQMFSEFRNNLYNDDVEALELFEKLQEDLQASVAQKNSRMNEPVQNDHKDVQMHFETNDNIGEEKKCSDNTTICHLCGTKIVGPALKWDGIEVTGALMIHFSSDCSFVSNYAIRVNEFAEKWNQCLKEQRLEPYQDIRSFFSVCNKFFIKVASNVELLPKSKGPIKKNKCFGAIIVEESNEIDQLDSEISVLKDDLYSGVSAFQNMIQPLFKYATVYSTTKDDKFDNQKYYYLLDQTLELSATGRRTYLVQDEAVVWQNPTEVEQQQKLANLTRYWCSACQRIFSCIELWQHHRNPDCKVCDVFFDSKYDHSFGSGLKFGSPIRKFCTEQKKLAVAEIKLLNSQYKFEKAKVAKLSAEEKRTPLEQRRVDQEISIKSQFKLSKGDLLIVEDWLLSLSHQFQSNDPFTKVGNPICDAIILPVCPEIFGDDKTHNSKMKAFLLKHSIPVAHVTCARKEGCVFVGLEDSRNQFTEDLLRHLKSAMADLVQKVREVKGNWRNIYIRQIDYTQDLLGFFMSQNVLADLKIFSEKLDIPYSRVLQQLATCFQFTSTTLENDFEVPNTRIKLYNKWVHLLTSGQKKWISMDLKKLFEPSTAFFIDKILPTLSEGFSRFELSTYFYSQEQQQQLFTSMNLFQQNIGNAIDVLNSMPQLNYRMSLNQCIESYFQMIDNKSTLIAYEDDLHAVAYSYCQRSCGFSGYLVNTTNKSEQPADFLRRFGRSVNKIFIHADKFCISKEGQTMQIPISSLNEKHRQIPDAYLLKSVQLCGYLDERQLKRIKLNCQDPKFYHIFGGDSGIQTTNFDVGQLVNYEYDQQDIETNQQNFFGEDIADSESRGETRRREIKSGEKYQSKLEKTAIIIQNQDREGGEHWKRKGISDSGKQRWECLTCQYRTVAKEKGHNCARN